MVTTPLSCKQIKYGVPQGSSLGPISSLGLIPINANYIFKNFVFALVLNAEDTFLIQNRQTQTNQKLC